MMTKTVSVLMAAAIYIAPSFAFVVAGPRTCRPRTHLNLEDHIADLIDKELYRQRHKDEFEKKAAEEFKKAAAVHVHDLPDNLEVDDSFLQQDFISPREKARDRKLARENPESYCADRCVATGNCDVFEDMFDMSPEDVVKFCDECVLSEDEEPCDVPEALLNPKDPLADLSP